MPPRACRRRGPRGPCAGSPPRAAAPRRGAATARGAGDRTGTPPAGAGRSPPRPRRPRGTAGRPRGDRQRHVRGDVNRRGPVARRPRPGRWHASSPAQTRALTASGSSRSRRGSASRPPVRTVKRTGSPAARPSRSFGSAVSNPIVIASMSPGMASWVRNTAPSFGISERTMPRTVHDWAFGRAASARSRSISSCRLRTSRAHRR